MVNLHMRYRHFFVFKQKTAYVMRISDWSSDVCSSDLNACEAVGQHGYLLHAAPLNRYNHGFWSFNPTVYADYFRDNGFSLRFISGVECKLAEGFSTFPVNLTGRFGKVPDNAALYVLAERVEVRPQVWPMTHQSRGSEGRRGGKESVSTCSSRWTRYHKQKKRKIYRE